MQVLLSDCIHFLFASMPTTDKKRWGATEDKRLADHFNNVIKGGATEIPLDNLAIEQAWQLLEPTRQKSPFTKIYRRKAEAYNAQLREKAENKKGTFIYWLFSFSTTFLTF